MNDNLPKLLNDCAEKLSLYYQRDPSYVGGIEHSELQRRIEAVRAAEESAASTLDDLRPMLGMMGWDGTHTEAVAALIAARDQHFEQACLNGQSAQNAKSALYVPGAMACAKCGYRLQRVVFGALDGGNPAGDNKTEPCPNGCGPLWPVTWEQEARELRQRLDPKPRPIAEYHEDMGPVVWWRFPVSECAWIGMPSDYSWIPGYYTHFTPHPVVPEAPSS